MTRSPWPYARPVLERRRRTRRSLDVEWYAWAVRTRLKPIVEKAKMLKRHLPRLLSYFRHRITNAAGEGFNSRIQANKSAARGFRNFEHDRTRILFFCGKLKLLPDTTHGIP